MKKKGFWWYVGATLFVIAFVGVLVPTAYWLAYAIFEAWSRILGTL